MTAHISDQAARLIASGFSAVLSAERRSMTKRQRLDVAAMVVARAAPLEERTMPNHPGSATRTIDKLLSTRDAALRRGEVILEAAAGDGDRNLYDYEERMLADIKSEAETLNRKISELSAMEHDESAAAEARAPFEAILNHGPEIRAGKTYGAYYPESGQSYFRDLLSAQHGDGAAIQRLQQNDGLGSERPEYRAGTTGSTSVGSFIPPVWLLDEVALLARAGRVVPGLVQEVGPPTSTSMTVPRITTGSVTAIQATENTSIGTQDWVTAQLTRTTSTIGGYQDVSIQSIELAPTGVDRLILADLTADYNRALDSQMIIGTGANNQLLGLDTLTGVNGVTYTQASPTVPLLYSQIANASTQTYTGRFLPPDAILMAPRRWAYLCAASDTTGRPLVETTGVSAFNTTAVDTITVTNGHVGSMQGLPVYADANVPTTVGGTQDEIYVARFGDMLLYESAPRTEVFRDIGSANATVRFRIYAFVNFFCGRYPAGVSRITGTGLVPPVF